MNIATASGVGRRTNARITRYEGVYCCIVRTFPEESMIKSNRAINAATMEEKTNVKSRDVDVKTSMPNQMNTNKHIIILVASLSDIRIFIIFVLLE
jgi:hypothetical protein